MTEEQLVRIRLLSDRFHELHGLRIALFGAALVFSQTAGLFIPSSPPDLAGGLMLFFALIVASPGLYRLKHYYASTFGRQVRKAPPRWKSWMAFGVLGFAGPLLADFLPRGLVMPALASALALWVAARDWPFRGYYLLAPMAVGLAFAAITAGIGGLDPSRTLAVTYLALGLAMVPIGLLDHRLLVTLVNEARSAGAAVSLAEPSRK
jgi:hypothetical protein